MITKTTKIGSITSMIILIMLAFCCQTAIAQGRPLPLIETDKNIYNYGEQIRVHFLRSARLFQEIGYVSYRKALWILKLETINIYQGEARCPDF